MLPVQVPAFGFRGNFPRISMIIYVAAGMLPVGDLKDVLFSRGNYLMWMGLPRVAGIVSALAVAGVFGVVSVSAICPAPAARAAVSAAASDQDPIWDVVSVESDVSGQSDPIWD
ncbi:hypothetical protein AB0D38_27930 [Streptomyces sp. NPDC048279]|uniref:hypothetical protein n=1 Tax=Streptomyces sp. NPDC048279 TaxID=3154714 RepID=UPI003430196B